VRSGSTWLQHIVVQTYGQSLRYVPFWESLGGGIELDPKRPGSLKKLATWTMSNMKNFPSLSAMHEVSDLYQAEEETGWTDMTCRGFLTAMINDNPGLDLQAVQPSSARMRYSLLKVVMQIKQWQEGPQRWVFKSPEHLNGAKELADTFPDAKVVTIHRDEAAVYKSLLVLFHITRSMSLPYVSPEVSKVASDIQLCSQRRGLKLIPTLEIDSLQLHFRDVIAQPVETLRQFASFAGLDWNAAIETRAEAAVEAAALRKKNMGGKVVYQLGPFGLTEAGIQERLDNCETESFGSSAITEPEMKISGLQEQVEGTICTMSFPNVTEITNKPQ